MTNPTPHGQVPEALRLAYELEIPIEGYPEATELERNAAAELRRLHAYCQELESQVIRDCMTHVQNPAENEHVAGDLSKNSAKKNMNVYAELPQSVGDHKYGGGLYTDAQMLAFADATHALRTQQPCPTCAALARTVMCDQASFDRKPDCYGIRQITEDEGVEEWEDIRTSPDVAREEADDMMATGRGELYEVVPLWTTPQCAPTEQAAECVPAVDGSLEVADAMADSQYLAGVSAGWNAANADDPNAALQKLHESRAGYLKPLVAARDPAESVTAPAGGVVAGMSETVQFSDKSKAPPLEKALRYLKAMGDQRTNSAYFFDDGYPRRDSAQDALATLAVLEQLAATPPAQAAPSVLEDAARLDWLLLRISGAEFRRIGVHYSGNARRADVDAARKQGESHVNP